MSGLGMQLGLRRFRRGVIGRSATPVAPSLILDNITNSVGAYSIRKLRTEYTGACIKIRRSSDNTELDIGFVNNLLDTDAMLEFVGAGNGFVSVWYDQSGNSHDIVSSDTTREAAIISNGTLIVGDTGKPVLSTDGVNDFFYADIPELSTAPALSFFITFSTSLAAGANTSTSYAWGMGNTQVEDRALIKASSTGALSGEFVSFDVRRTRIGLERLGSSSYRRDANTSVIESDFVLNTGLRMFQNGSEIDLDLTSSGASPDADYTPESGNLPQRIYFSCAYDVNVYKNFRAQKYSEIILFATDKSEHRQLLENDISSFFFNVNLPVNVIYSNPYSGVNFETVNAYKADLHSHTSQSDGVNTPEQLADAFSAKGYNVLAITDHDTYPTVEPLPTYPLSSFSDYTPTSETAGSSAELYPEVGLLMIQANEITGLPATTIHHRVSLFNDMWTSEQISSGEFDTRKNDIQWTLSKIAEKGGLSILAHPSKHPDFGTTYDLAFYTGLVNNTENLLGVEVKNSLAYNDEPLWDSLLNSISGKNIWGFSNSDVHNITVGCGTNYNMIFAASLTKAAIYNALRNGQFYFVIDSAGANIARHNPNATPIISNIIANNYSIEITALNTISIEWINNGNVIFTGSKFIAGNFSGINYVRAKLTGINGGYAFTQAFKIN
jgi:hypothetical protein